ncbi:hypothetical protein T07_9803, partial [Trichinella nelsoni]
RQQQHHTGRHSRKKISFAFILIINNYNCCLFIKNCCFCFSFEQKMNNSKESQPKVTHEEFQNELRNFDSDQLRHIEPTEKVVLPSKEDVIQEKVEIAHQNVLVDVSQFQRHSLQHADTNERVYLPTKDEVKQERMEQAYTGVLKEVSTFERNSLTHSEPVEKYHMPTKEELAREKVMHQVPGFDQSKLKHA